MSKSRGILPGHIILAGFFLTFGLLYLLLGLLRYTFVFSRSWAILSIFICIVIVLLTVKAIKNRAEQVEFSSLAAVCLPLLALFFVLTKGIATDIDRLLLILLSYLSVICAIILYVSCGHKKRLKIAFSIVYGLILVPMFLFSLIMLFGTIFMGDFGRIEVTNAAPSPNAVYLAEIISNDRGALGGHTEINITEQNRNINLLIGELQPNPRRVYFGGWWEYMDMSLRWESDDVLYVYTRDDTIRFLRQGRNWMQSRGPGVTF